MDEQEEESQDTCYDKFKLVHKHVQRFLVFYNLVFIPLQFAFNIRFRSVFLVMEIVTIVVYLVEMGIRIYKYKRLK